MLETSSKFRSKPMALVVSEVSCKKNPASVHREPSCDCKKLASTVVLVEEDEELVPLPEAEDVDVPLPSEEDPELVPVDDVAGPI